MKKIVMLPGTDMVNKLFSKDSLQKLSALGEFIVNSESASLDLSKTKALIKNANVIISSWGSPKFDKELLDEAPNLELLLHAAGSIKGMVTPEFWEGGIRVSNSAEPLGKGVAETALGFTIASLKNMWSISDNIKSGDWSKGRDKVRELYNVTVGVIGAGCAGRHYIRLLNNFDVDILLYDPMVSIDKAKSMGAQKVELKDLLKAADVISIHAPSIPQTNKMFNKETLSIMKDDAILINTARGTIIDEQDLLVELYKGRLFVCLDVTDPEPPSIDHPFRNLPNVILTSHIAGAVNNGQKRIGNFITEEFERYLLGKKLVGEIHKDELSVLA